MPFIHPCFFGRKHYIPSVVEIIIHLAQSLDWKEIFYFGMKFTIITKHPSSPPGAEIGPLCSPISADKRPIWARIGPYSAWFAVSRRSIINTIFSYHIFHHKIKYFNKIVQQQIVRYKLYSSTNKNSYFITQRPL